MTVVRLVALAVAFVAAACALRVWSALVDWMLDDERLDGVAIQAID